MGRMAEARKRAKQKSTPGGASPPEPSAARERSAPPPAAAREAAEALPPPPGKPAEKPREPAPRIELPPSGLAAEVLAREDAAAVSLEAPTVAEPEPAGEEAARRRHTLSFFAAPAREERATVEPMEHLATFFVGAEEYGVDVRVVQEIRRVGEITQVPRAPDFIRGVMNLRGRVIPVVDLKRKLGVGEALASKASRIVVVRIRERLLGLLVDGASQVLKVPVSVIESPPEEVVAKGGDYIRGVAKLERRLIILVELETILARELGAAAEAGPGA